MRLKERESGAILCRSPSLPGPSPDDNCRLSRGRPPPRDPGASRLSDDLNDLRALENLARDAA